MANFHQQPFDEGTATKLSLFATYAREWLPVFVCPRRRGATVTIVDFFAGPGRDITGREGTPLLLLRTIREFSEQISKNEIKVRLLLNEAAKRKADVLRAVMDDHDVPTELCTWSVHNLAFEDAFQNFIPELKAGPNLLLLDQQGMKFISDDVFRSLISLQSTDFAFFIASSFIRRFRDHKHFKRYLPVPGETIQGRKFGEIHRAVTDHYRTLVPAQRRMFLAQFSIRKGANIYGLIFGSGHILGIDKFLRACWEIDPDRGEANFDIDGDAIDGARPFLFSEMNVPRKVTRFSYSLRSKLLTGDLVSDADVYEECLKEGMLPRHGREVLTAMIKAGEVLVESGKQPRVSQDGYKGPRRLEVTK